MPRKNSKTMTNKCANSNSNDFIDDRVLDDKKRKKSTESLSVDEKRDTIKTRSKSKSLEDTNGGIENIDKVKISNNNRKKKSESMINNDDENDNIKNISNTNSLNHANSMNSINNNINDEIYKLDSFEYEEEFKKKNIRNSECKRRRNLKDMKYFKEIKPLKDIVNLKNNNHNNNNNHQYNNGIFSSLTRFCGYNSKNSFYSNRSKQSTSSNSNLQNNTNLINSDSFESKLQTFKIRLQWTFILILIYFIILGAGHFYCSLLVLILVTTLYKEIISLKSIENKDKKLPEIFYIRWYWFFLTIITLGIPWVIPKLKHQIPLYKFLLTYHSINMFILAFVGFVWFILSLRKFSLKYQFSQIGIILLSSLFIVTQSLMHIANIYSGMIWFIVPVSSVVINDIFAYVFGILFGKTRLIQLSPKKTVEGYVGSSIITIVWGILITYFLQKYKFFICPQKYITFKPFVSWNYIDCDINPIFQQKVYEVPTHISSLISIKNIYYSKMLFHGLMLSLFAAFLAPFGGFFASGFKRALKIKDFGKSIPGHGGVTDRFDCQIFIGMFTYIYMKTFVKIKGGIYSYDLLIESIQKLDHKEIIRLFNQIKNMVDKKRKKSCTDSNKNDIQIRKDKRPNIDKACTDKKKIPNN
ncbi:cytidine diphosphate-diacylglycerol synthase [Plasmodium gaboni]|uniref:Phosphatidate cytidylyltransferase n=1 Tax=Plasmodium gaboni TaxID=647221 RepID=A0A151L9S8_9APIC|nr:cytidine diphosphate-diacylglycerol synthase [Plasmodium gaboni]KYN95710.1 cytidine diphosphate-diacylglycerol synthase [Plasmodium gaboni]